MFVDGLLVVIDLHLDRLALCDQMITLSGMVVRLSLKLGNADSEFQIRSRVSQPPHMSLYTYCQIWLIVDV